MYPTVLRIGSFEVTSFGVLVAAAALVGIWIFGRELARSGLPAEASNAAIAGVLGGLFGAKLLWTIEFMHQAPAAELLFSRGGLSWFGGLFGGVITGLIVLRRYGVPLWRGLAAATPALATGHAIGRIGCFLVGDDYGRPTDLPWGVAFPEGLPPTTVPVHPTQLYEAFLLVPVAWLLIVWRRRGVPDRLLVGRYLVMVGSIRFGIEFIRINEPVLGPAPLAQLIALLLVASGAALSLAGRPRAVR
jgi:phosphatidylglycerol:prolipoprotein diacylglycerol transferase